MDADRPRRDDDRLVAAKLHEVDVRYAADAKARRAASGERNLLVGQLLRLFRGRGHSEQDARRLVDDLGELEAWSPEALGQAVGLTFEEVLKFRITFLKCCDRSQDEVDEYYRAARRRRDRLSKQCKRAAEPKRPKGLTQQEEELLSQIGSDLYLERSRLVELAATLPSFRRLRDEARKQAVRRALGRLSDRLCVELDTTAVNDRGQSIVLVRRV